MEAFLLLLMPLPLRHVTLLLGFIRAKPRQQHPQLPQQRRQLRKLHCLAPGLSEGPLWQQQQQDCLVSWTKRHSTQRPLLLLLLLLLPQRHLLLWPYPASSSSSSSLCCGQLTWLVRRIKQH